MAVNQNPVETGNTKQTDKFIPVKNIPEGRYRYGFDKVVSGNVDSSMDLIITGTGQTVNQTAGNLVLTTGTTARAETIISGTQSITDAFTMRWMVNYSQRIANASFYVELVDVVGNSLAYSITSATAITVTFGTNPFTSANVGQSMYLAGFVGTGTFLSGYYPIASVSGSTVTYTVSGFAIGTGTVQVFGWNYHHILYNGTSATTAQYGTGRNGWPYTDVSATTNTTAAPGHVAIVNAENGIGTFIDQVTTTSTSYQLANRASSVRNLPDSTVPLYWQIRMLNGSTAPASTTTATFSFLDIENYQPQQMSLVSVRAQSQNAVAPVLIVNTATTTGVAANAVATIQAAAAQTASNNSSSYTGATTMREANITLNCTAASGTTPTLNVSIQASDDSGTTWYPLYYPNTTTPVAFTQLTAAGTQMLSIAGNLSTAIRAVSVIAGTTPSFTYAIKIVAKS